MRKNLAHNFAKITRQIQSAVAQYQYRSKCAGHKVALVAVSKYQNLDSMRMLYQAGQCIFGENKVQDLREKVREFFSPADTPISSADTPAIQWHFIGTLQRNKINTLLSLNPTLIHSIDTIDLALSLNEKCKAQDRIQPVLLQVNAANDPSKHGFSLESTCDAFAHIYTRMTHLRLQGLMCIGAHTRDICAIEESFAKTKAMYDVLQARFDGVETLSMGMSGDFIYAIKHGANMVRIGSALFA